MPPLTLIWANNKTGNENAPEANLRLLSNQGLVGREEEGAQNKNEEPDAVPQRGRSLYVHPQELLRKRSFVCRFLACLPFSLPYSVSPHVVQSTGGNLSLSVSSIWQPQSWNRCKSHNKAASLLILQQSGLYNPKLPMSDIAVGVSCECFSLWW